MSRLKPCRQSGCAANVEGGGYCPKHKRDNDRTRDPVSKQYNNSTWDGKIGVQRAVLHRNPVCQKLHVEKGWLVRCPNVARLVHHLQGARCRPDLFLAVYDERGKSNLIALCWRCHPTEVDGTPHWQEAREGDPVPPGGGDFFVRTEFSINV